MTGGVPRNRATVQPRTLASEPRILDRFAEDLHKAGLVGEEAGTLNIGLDSIDHLLCHDADGIGQQSDGLEEV